MSISDLSKTDLATGFSIGLHSAGISMTPEEFDAIVDYDDCYRYELIRGVLVVNPIPSEQQASPNEFLGGLLFVYKEQHPKGAVLDVTLPERYIRVGPDRRRADRVIWTGLGRRPDTKADVPTIAVEFVSQGRRNIHRDYIEKRDEYLGVGVQEYWVIDRFARTMSVFRQQEGEMTEYVVQESETYQSDILPGFELPLAKLLAAADAWDATETES